MKGAGSFSSEHLFMSYCRRGVKVLWNDPQGHFFPSVPGHRSEMLTLLSCCDTTKQPMFSRQRRHCVTNSEITPNIPTCVLQTFFCTVHSVRPAPSADSLKNISPLLTGFNVSAARDFSSRQQQTSSRRRGVRCWWRGGGQLTAALVAKTKCREWKIKQYCEVGMSSFSIYSFHSHLPT